MEMTRRTVTDVVVIEVEADRLSASDSNNDSPRLSKALTGCVKVALDLRMVRHLENDGMAVLFESTRAFKKAGGWVLLVLSEQGVHAIRQRKLDSPELLAEVFTTLEDALQRFQQSRARAS